MCDKIIEANVYGTIVLDENFRTGRCARKVHGEGTRKTQLRKRDLKSTHLLELPVHPALKGAYTILMGGGSEGRGGSGERVNGLWSFLSFKWRAGGQLAHVGS